MNKKAQGLSLTTIIVTAIALIVLVILIMVFTNRICVFDECKPTYNSDIHECTYWEKSDNFQFGETIQLKEDGSYKCYDWRQKTICEFDPNNPECICDEYEEYSLPIKTCEGVFESERDIKLNCVDWDVRDRKFEDEYWQKCEYLYADCPVAVKKTRCISAHEPITCEVKCLDIDGIEWKSEYKEGFIESESRIISFSFFKSCEEVCK